MSFIKHLLPTWKRGLEARQKTNAAILYAIDTELTEAEQEAIQAKVLMSLETATEEWLDRYGSAFGVTRQDAELDTDYRARIISYILLKRGTIPAITEAIRNFLQDYSTAIEIYEPHTNIFFLNGSTLNGADHILGEYYTYAVIDVKMARGYPVGLMAIINEFKPSGVKVYVTDTTQSPV